MPDSVEEKRGNADGVSCPDWSRAKKAALDIVARQVRLTMLLERRRALLGDDA
jgi:hypothetical protein